MTSCDVTRPPPTPWQPFPRVFRHSGGLGPPLSIPYFRGLTGQVFPPAGNLLPSPLFCPMAASGSRCVCILGGDIPGVALTGRCAPWDLSRTASLRLPHRHRQLQADLPHPLRGISVLLCRRPLRLLSTPLGAFISALLPVYPIHTVLPPCSVVAVPHQWVLHIPIFSRSPVLPSSMLQLSPSSRPTPFCASTLRHPCFSPLIHYPHPRRPLGFCVRPLHSIRPTRPLPRPWPPISPVRMKMSAIGRAGARHAGRLRADTCRTGSSLTCPSLWWGTASAGPCSCT